MKAVVIIAMTLAFVLGVGFLCRGCQKYSPPTLVLATQL
jgi:hypothetical protein